VLITTTAEWLDHRDTS